MFIIVVVVMLLLLVLVARTVFLLKDSTITIGLRILRLFWFGCILFARNLFLWEKITRYVIVLQYCMLVDSFPYVYKWVVANWGSFKIGDRLFLYDRQFLHRHLYHFLVSRWYELVSQHAMYLLRAKRYQLCHSSPHSLNQFIIWASPLCTCYLLPRIS